MYCFLKLFILPACAGIYPAGAESGFADVELFTPGVSVNDAP